LIAQLSAPFECHALCRANKTHAAIYYRSDGAVSFRIVS